MVHTEILDSFYRAIVGDARICTSHISLFMAIFQQWNQKEVSNQMPISRDILLHTAKISRKTYHKCMRELHAYGYIVYRPSPNPKVPSEVRLLV